MPKKQLAKVNWDCLKNANSGDARTAKKLYERITKGTACPHEIAKFKKLTRGVRG